MRLHLTCVRTEWQHAQSEKRFGAWIPHDGLSRSLTSVSCHTYHKFRVSLEYKVRRTGVCRHQPCNAEAPWVRLMHLRGFCMQSHMTPRYKVKKTDTHLSSLACLCSSLLSRYSRLEEVFRANEKRRMTGLDVHKIMKQLLRGNALENENLS